MSDPRLARPEWRGRTNVDALTIACIEHAEQLAGREFVVTQGSYQSGVAASAGTHDLGGVVDLRWSTVGNDGVLALRKAGMAAWHRTPAQGPWPDHVHAVVIGHPLLAPSAARQVDDYFAGRNGLANHAADDGPRLNPIPRPVWPWPQEDDMAFTEEQLRKIVREAVGERPINVIGGDQVTADAAIAQILNRTGQARTRLAVIRHQLAGALEELPDDATKAQVRRVRGDLAQLRDAVDQLLEAVGDDAPRG